MRLTEVSESSWGTTYFYVPDLITDARLFMGAFDPLPMDLSTGLLGEAYMYADRSCCCEGWTMT